MSTAVRSPHDQVAAELHAIGQRRQRALVDADLETLGELFDNTLVYTHAHGITHTKAQLLEHAAKRRPYLKISRGELIIRLVGDIAIVTGPLTNQIRTPDGAQHTLAGVATQVLRRDNQRGWRFINFQMTPYGEQS